MTPPQYKRAKSLENRSFKAFYTFILKGYHLLFFLLWRIVRKRWLGCYCKRFVH